MTYPAFNQSSTVLGSNGAITMSGISHVIPIKVARNLKEAFEFTIKGREVSATFADQPNFQLVSYLKEILLGDAKPPAYKAAAKAALSNEHSNGFNMDSVRKHIPAEIPNDAVEDYTAKALEYYHQSFQNHPASSA